MSIRFVLVQAVLALTVVGCGDEGEAVSVDGGAHDGTLVDTSFPVDGNAVSDGGDASTTPCWPYDRPSTAALRASEKKVFAHYFSPFPISLDNKPAASDYYTVNYLNPAGENGKFAGSGGFLRERPLPQTPWPGSTDYVEANLEIEIRRAIAIGLDGFTFDVLQTDTTSAGWLRLVALLKAIPKVDPEFRVQLVFACCCGHSPRGSRTPRATADCTHSGTRPSNRLASRRRRWPSRSPRPSR